MKEILKWQLISTVEFASELCSSSPPNPSIVGKVLCHCCCWAAKWGVVVTSWSSEPSCERSHHSLFLLCCSLAFHSLDWVVFSVSTSQSLCCLVGKVNWKKKKKKSQVVFPAPSVKLHTNFGGFVGSFGVSIFISVCGRLLWGSLVGASIQHPFAKQWGAKAGWEMPCHLAARTVCFIISPCWDRVKGTNQHWQWDPATQPPHSPAYVSWLWPCTVPRCWGQKLLVVKGKMEGSSCEVNLQTLLPHSGGTAGLSLEQNFSHQVLLLLSGSDHSLRQNPVTVLAAESSAQPWRRPLSGSWHWNLPPFPLTSSFTAHW